tara:strand:- start:269 stop:514 length:246 start_codon:yes stop_codon:yes gene_type:complete
MPYITCNEKTDRRHDNNEGAASCITEEDVTFSKSHAACTASDTCNDDFYFRTIEFLPVIIGVTLIIGLLSRLFKGTPKGLK